MDTEFEAPGFRKKDTERVALAIFLLILAYHFVRAQRVDEASRGNERLSSSLLLLVLGEERADEVLGDLEEVYGMERAEHGKTYADRRYILALFALIAHHLYRALARLALRKGA